MRPLTEEETKTVFSKLATYCSDLKSLISPLDDGDRYVFRLNHARVYYVRLSIANIATSVSRDQLLSLGTCLGKLTKTGKFRLHITALPILAENARHKIWVKENGAQPFLYGSNGMFPLFPFYSLAVILEYLRPGYRDNPEQKDTSY